MAAFHYHRLYRNRVVVAVEDADGDDVLAWLGRRIDVGTRMRQRRVEFEMLGEGIGYLAHRLDILPASGIDRILGVRNGRSGVGCGERCMNLAIGEMRFESGDDGRGGIDDEFVADAVGGERLPRIAAARLVLLASPAACGNPCIRCMDAEAAAGLAMGCFTFCNHRFERRVAVLVVRVLVWKPGL